MTKKHLKFVIAIAHFHIIQAVLKFYVIRNRFKTLQVFTQNTI